MNLVYCVKLKEELEGLEHVPFPGELGERIYANVSKQAWQGWLQYQVMLINENGLNLAEASVREYLKKQMEFYLFGG